ncbi:MAG: orotate phosphoribosyltransferase [Candidatus Accumulibacter sp.]|jgi:orotate phosphoribosyltransferase|nr:orotate phosphoribosyltransferase [Accumulibacter sp.]
MDFHLEFIEFILASKALRFGEFKIKSGRLSPYFFNAGLFDDGHRLDRLSQFYARAVLESGISVDTLFGPAYKGIPLVVGCAIALARSGKNLPYAFNRKEAKDHGEGGMLVGAPLSGNVLIIDDVISAGTSVRESIDLIRAAGATPCGVVIALDRMERGMRELSAVQEVQRDFGVPVVAIATLNDLTTYLRGHPDFKTHETRILRYRQEYGIENLD